MKQTKAELIKEIEDTCIKLIGTRFKYNLLNGFRGYKHWNIKQLIEFKTLYLSDETVQSKEIREEDGTLVITDNEVPAGMGNICYD